MAGVAVITAACVGVEDRAGVGVRPVQRIDEFDVATITRVSKIGAGSGVAETRHAADPDACGI